MLEKSTKQKWISTLQFLAAYLVAAWTFLQFVDWALNRYNLSPNWVDLLLWTFIGIIPSLTIYLYHKERINKGVIKLKEKIFIPINIVLLITVLIFAFGNTDLGAMTKNVTFEDAGGNLATKTITKEEFRTGFNIYSFKQEQEKDSAISWLSFGIGRVLYQDLIQNKNLSPEFDRLESTSDKIRDASLFYDKYVDGSFKRNGNSYSITASIRKASNAKVLQEKTVEGEDLFQLLDQISLFIASELDSKKQNVTYIDLPISEHMTSSLEALKAFVNFDYNKAFEIDPKFALAYLEEAKYFMSENKGRLEAQDLIEKAFALKNKLPLQKQLEVLIQKNLAYGNYKEAEQQVKLQLEVDPNNRFYNTVLFSLYGESKNTQAYFEASERLFNNNRSSYNGNNLMTAAMVAGYEKNLLSALNALEVIDPYLKYLKVQPLVLSGKTDEARSVVQDYKMSYTQRNRLIPYDTIFNFLEDKSIDDIDLSPFVGRYRSNNNELTTEFWMEEDRLIEYTKHQPMKAHLPAGIDAIGGGSIGDHTYIHRLLRDKNGKVFALLKTYYNWNSTGSVLYWKLNSTIENAQLAFENKDYDKAMQLYASAKVTFPDHVYLDHILNHLKFRKQNDSVAIMELYHKHKGTYGPRKFWIEGNKFYYKRQDETINLAKVELLPINDTLFMDMTRLGTLMTFTEEEGKVLSKAYSLDYQDFQYKVKNKAVNIIEKTSD